MRDFKFNANGILKKSKEVWLNDAGIMRQADEVWFNDAGTLRQVFPLGFSKIKFVSSAWGVKTNYGTSEAYLKDSADNVLWSMVGGSNYVCPTSGTTEYEIPVVGSELPSKITLKRYIDTDSGGGATMYVSLWDNQTDSWIQVLAVIQSYRTGNGWSTGTWNLTINQ